MTDFLDQISSFSPKRLALLAAKLKERLDRVEAANREPIAVIGLGCRFPGGDSPDGYWSLLTDGRDATREIPADRWAIEHYFDPDKNAPGKMSTRRGGFLDRIDEFDPQFFGISPREAVVMDPQQRLLLEVSWEALEHAGLVPEALAGSRTGVFVGICNYDYHQLLLARGPEGLDAYVATGNAHSVTSGRVAYLMGLQGPALSIDTACSASLVAIHAACQSLRNGETKLALAGGVNIICAPDTMISLSRGQMLAPDGRCKTFDAAADGFSRGEGCGMVVLKQFSDARRDGDRILALVRGSAVNQDGRSSGLTVPNGPAQEAVIRDALAMAGLDGADIDYVEAHGTGTSLGDPIEVRALARALAGGRDKAHPLLIGSVKTNIGHLESAAGVAGFIKAVLALQNEEIPRHLNFQTPNPHIEWADLPVLVAADRRAWPRGVRSRRAGVSSFGFSGTNAHVILEEAPVVERTGVGSSEISAVETPRVVDEAEASADSNIRGPVLCLPLSARTQTALGVLAERYAQALRSDGALSLADAAWTAGVGRSHFGERVAIVAKDKFEAITLLEGVASGQPSPKIHRGSVPPGVDLKPVFLYTGQGSQYPGMGRTLYETSPIYKEAIDHCDALLGPDPSGLTLRDVLIAADGGSPIDETRWTQPALFALEYALTQLWRSWGVEPAAVTGHSLGEYVAACVAGTLSLDDGLCLVAERGRLMQRLTQPGAMAVIFAPLSEVESAVSRVADRVSVAAVNTPDSAVISGETRTVDEILAEFNKRGVHGHRLVASRAMHSPLMNPALEIFEEHARRVTMRAPRIPIVWNLSEAPTEGEAPSPMYWRRHMREPVRFADGMNKLYRDGYRLFIEIGPQPTLTALARRSLPAEGTIFLGSLHRSKDDWRELISSLAEFYVQGGRVEWAALTALYSPRRVALPTYPFERDRYWVDELPSRGKSGGRSRVEIPNAGPLATDNSPGTPTGEELAHLLYRVDWRPKPHDVATKPVPASGSWLVFADSGGVGVSAAGQLSSGDRTCFVVESGERYQRLSATQFIIRPDNSEDVRRLLQDTVGSGACAGIVYLWGLDAHVAPDASAADLERAQHTLSAALLRLIKELVTVRWPGRIPLWLVTQGTQAAGQAAFEPGVLASIAWGLGRSLAVEHAALWGGLIDLDPTATVETSAAALVAQVTQADGEDQVAFRGKERFVARLVRPPNQEIQHPIRWKTDASYLITGGLGGLGLQLARWMIEQGARHLVLLGRSALPPRSEWSLLDPESSIGPRVAAVRALEGLGASVRVVAVDVADERGLRDFLMCFRREGRPPIRGVVHAAGTMLYAPLMQMTAEQFESVLRSKVTGAWLLHHLLAAEPLDFFVLFSSASAVLSSPLIGGYAAANAFLDSLAHCRASAGLPALSINWGAWAGAGMVQQTAAEVRGAPSSHGVLSLDPTQALAALSILLGTSAVQMGVIPVDWPSWRAIYPGFAATPFFSEIFLDASNASTSTDGGSLSREAYLTLDPKRLEQEVRHRLLAHAGAVLRIDPEVIGLREPLTTLGIDSLMAVELKNRVDREFGPFLDVVHYLNGSGIEPLTEIIIESLREAAAAEANSLLKRLPELSESELDALLSRMQTPKPNHE